VELRPDRHEGRRHLSDDAGPYRAVLFDFGGVVSSSPFALMEEVGAKMGLEPGVLSTLLMGDYGADGDDPWHRLERGEITAGEWFTDVLRRAEEQGIAIDVAHFHGGFYGGISVHEPVVAHIRGLRDRGFKTGLLTNNVKEFAGWRDLVPLAELFDIVVDSCEVGMRKPGAAIYRHTLDLLGVGAEETVFLDDHPANVAGAEAVGMTALLVGPDPQEALTELERLLTA
jgi:putative hydrolase of the HAD superfamily